MPENQKSILLLLFRKYTHVTNSVLKVCYMLGHNLLRHASLGLYNHFDTHEAQHHNTIFNHCSDILPNHHVLQIPTVRTHVCVCV